MRIKLCILIFQFIFGIPAHGRTFDLYTLKTSVFVYTLKISPFFEFTRESSHRNAKKFANLFWRRKGKDSSPNNRSVESYLITAFSHGMFYKKIAVKHTFFLREEKSMDVYGEAWIENKNIWQQSFDRPR